LAQLTTGPNIYLYYVFDLWAQQWRQRHAHGDVIMVRYADDIVVGFEHQVDAERFWEDMRTRLAEFALTLQRADRLSLHRSASRLDPGKTRLIEFGRHAVKNRRVRGLGKPATFDFLGFTHISGHSRRGDFQLRRKSRSDRVRAKLQVVKETLRRRMHETIDEQGAWLRRVVMGFNAYHAVPTNSAALGDFRFNRPRCSRVTRPTPPTCWNSAARSPTSAARSPTCGRTWLAPPC
jgi:hypothetical protein